MRRPTVGIGIAFAFGIAAADFFKLNNFGILASAAFAGAVFVLGFHIWKKRKNSLALLMALFFLAGALRFETAEAILCGQREALTAKGEAWHSGLILECAKKDEDRLQLVLATEQGKILVQLGSAPEDWEALPGNAGCFYGRAEAAQGARNPRCFDYGEHLRSKGIACVMKSEGPGRPGAEWQGGGAAERAAGRPPGAGLRPAPLLSAISLGKQRFFERLEKAGGPEVASLTRGMLFGDTSGIAENLYDEFRKNGTAHVLAVSGLHVGLVYAFAEFLTRKRRTKKAYLFKALFVLLYGLAAGFSPSAARACTMILLHIASKLLHKRYDMLTAGFAAAILNLAINPFALFSSGFQLSYMAIFTMAVIVRRLSCADESKGLKGVLLPAAGIQMGTAPLIAYHFNYFSILGLFINIPVIFIAGLALPIGISLFYTGGFLIPTGAGEGLFCDIFGAGAFVFKALCACLIRLNHLAFVTGKSYMCCISPHPAVLAIYYGILFTAFSETGFVGFKRRKLSFFALPLAATLLISAFFFAADRSAFDKAAFTFVDVGQGDCLHIRTEDGKNILIDSGGSAFKDVGEDVLLPYLLKNRIGHIDLAVVTHLHLDHYGGLASLDKFIDVEMVAVTAVYDEERVREKMPYMEGKLLFLRGGDTIEISKDTKIEVFLAGKDMRKRGKDEEIEDENDESLVLKATSKGVSALMTADIDSEGEKMVLDYCKKTGKSPKCTILKVAHHGSRYSSCEEFLKGVKPQIAVIQVGKNNYGHPADETLQRLASTGAIVYRNDLSGAIGIAIPHPGRLKILRMSEQESANDH